MQITEQTQIRGAMAESLAVPPELSPYRLDNGQRLEIAS